VIFTGINEGFLGKKINNEGFQGIKTGENAILAKIKMRRKNF